MRKWIGPLVLLASFIAPPVSASNLTCSPNQGSNCTYTGCVLCDGVNSICKVVPVTQVTEAACAICNTTAEIAYYGAAQPGAGTCVSTSGADSCVGCNWCTAVLYGCGGGGGYPPVCDPPHAHGPIQEIQAGDGVDAVTGKARSAPRGWILRYDKWAFLLLEYSGKSLFPTLGDHDEGLYFAQHPVSGMGWLASSREGMTQVLGNLLSSFGGDEAKMSRQNYDVGLRPPLPRSANLVSAGKWSVEWRAVPPLAPFYFPMGDYPRLMYRGRPATLKDLEANGIELEPVP